ncbi:MAG: UDP-N-acetylmuramoyl-L-alanyl-D-glutamate--2,6-diaminopimelate ligase [Buchnera aphidicola (Meitanaphis flavogallis)]
MRNKKKEYHGHITYKNKHIPVIYFLKLSKNLSKISNRYYEVNEELTLIGVTGTNGKSTVTHIIAQWNYLLNQRIGIMGSLGNGTYNDLKPSVNTTDSPINIQKFLKEMLINDIKTIAMEISSHGIIQHRVSNLNFSMAILTNITSDHLDYHKTIENYIKAKWTFFSKNKIKTFIINIDNHIGKLWTKKLSKKRTIVVSINKNFNYSLFKRWVHAYRIIYNTNYTYIYFKSSWGKGLLKSQLIGNFNVTNLLLALVALLNLGFSLSCLIDVCEYIIAVPGRMQSLKIPNKPNIIIDYAHNEDAFKNVLQTIRKIYHHNVWCVFGCGGNRDKLKRSLMGKISEKIANKIVLTNDNPRNENPKEIIKDITQNIQNKKNIHIILDRKQAIKFAIMNANINDCVVVLGKGHEKYQIIKNKTYYFSDYETIKKLLEK